MVVFANDSSEEKCILAVENFAKEYLSVFLDESFDKILKNFTQEAVKIASEYNFEFEKLRLASLAEKEQFMNLISE